MHVITLLAIIMLAIWLYQAVVEVGNRMRESKRKYKTQVDYKDSLPGDNWKERDGE